MYLRHAAMIIAIAVLAVPIDGAFAMNRKACKSLKKDHEKLLKTGIKKDMEQGAEWAQKNLPPERIESIKYLIEMEETLTFRCKIMVTAKPKMKPKPEPDPEAKAKKKKTTKKPSKKKKTSAQSKNKYTPPPNPLAFSPSGS